MSKPEDELEFINVVEHSSSSQGAGRSRSAIGGTGGEHGVSSTGNGRLGFIRQAHHPVAAFFHFAFKVLALLVYIFGGWSIVSSSAIVTYILCILLLAFDFWTVKNITGRLMVGLRWWSQVKEDGTNEWVFESLDNMEEVHSADSKLFWMGLYGTPLLWAGLFVIGVLRLQLKWLVIVVMALGLNGANIYGYTKCNADAKNKVRRMVHEGMMAGAVQGATAALNNSGIRNALFSMFGGSQQQSPPPQNQMGTHHI